MFRPYLFLFLSGVSSLIFQVVWVKLLGLSLGVDMYAVSIVISGYFAGLGVGAWWAGKKAKDIATAKKLYIFLEAGTAISAILVTFILWFGVPVFTGLESLFGRTVSYAIAWLLVTIPALFMGGTLIAMVRVVGEGFSERVGRLNSINILGAVTGTLITPFFLYQYLTVLGAAVFAAILNVVIVILALRWVPSLASQVSSIQSEPPVEKQADSKLKAIYWVYGVSGFVAIGLEVVWNQLIIQFMNTRTYSYAVILAVYLLGLALGSAWSSRRLAKTKTNLWGNVALFSFAIALFTLFASFGVTEDISTAIRDSVVGFSRGIGFASANMLLPFMAISIYFLFIPTFFMGAIFPYAVEIASEHSSQTAESSRLLAVNTWFGVFASLLTGFVILPGLGVERSIQLLLLISLALSVYSISRSTSSLKWAWGSGVSLCAVALLFLPSTKFVDLLSSKEDGAIISYQHDVGSSVAVLEHENKGRVFRRLYINGVSNTGDVMASKRYMRLQSFIPLVAHPGDPKSALVIGLGTGITGGALTVFPGLERREIVELLPEVVNATRHFSGNYHVADSDLVKIHVDDGRRYLARGHSQYDLITLEPPPPTASSVVNLYSSEFYELCKTRLSDDGVVAQWWPITTQSVDASKALVQSMLNNFKYVTLWTTELHEMLLVGSDKPQGFSLERVRTLMEDPAFAQSLHEVGINDEYAFASTYVADETFLAKFASDARPVTDNWPMLEFDHWIGSRVLVDILPMLIDEMAVPAGLSRAEIRKVEYEQDKLLAFYGAGISAYAKDMRSWNEFMTRVYRFEANNAYFNWYRLDRFASQ